MQRLHGVDHATGARLFVRAVWFRCVDPSDAPPGHPNVARYGDGHDERGACKWSGQTDSCSSGRLLLAWACTRAEGHLPVIWVGARWAHTSQRSLHLHRRALPLG